MAQIFVAFLEKLNFIKSLSVLYAAQNMKKLKEIAKRAAVMISRVLDKNCRPVRLPKEQKILKAWQQ